MNKHQMNKLAMYRATRALLVTAPETGTIVAFPPVFAALGDKIAAIETLMGTQRTYLNATIAHRETVMNDMIEAVLAVAGIGSSYATRNKLRDLGLKMNMKASDFARIRLDQRVHQAQLIVDTLRPYLPQLADYGLTAASLDAVQAKVAAADAVSPSARQTVAQKRAATFGLAEAFRDVDEMLTKDLDALLRPLQRTHWEFYQNYLAVREVVDRPGGRAGSPDESASSSPSAPAVEPQRQAA